MMWRSPNTMFSLMRKTWADTYLQSSTRLSCSPRPTHRGRGSPEHAVAAHGGKHDDSAVPSSRPKEGRTENASYQGRVADAKDCQSSGQDMATLSRRARLQQGRGTQCAGPSLTNNNCHVRISAGR